MCSGHTEDVQRGIEWLLGGWRVPMEWLLGAQRVCGGYRMISRYMERTHGVIARCAVGM